MDRSMLKTWINKVLKNFAKDLLQDKRGLLLIDGFEGHY